MTTHTEPQRLWVLLSAPGPWICAALWLALALAIPGPLMAQDSTPPDRHAQPKEKLADSEIATAIREFIIRSDAIDASKVSVEVANGAAVLTGSVDNLLAKRHASEIALAVKGVQTVANSIDVSPPHVPDEELKRTLTAGLTADLVVEANQIQLAVQEGKVALDGTVDSFVEKQIAEDLVASVRGVKAVDNRLRVVYAEKRLDSEMQKDIERRLETSVWADGDQITVTVTDGRVALVGTAGSAMEKQRIEHMAWVTGVQSVDASKIAVAWWQRDKNLRVRRYTAMREAEQIQEAVIAGMTHHPRLQTGTIKVAADDGIVTLSGHVESLAAKNAAADVARHTLGVWHVRNHLTVSPTEELTDETIESRIREALKRDPYVGRFDVTATVTNGHARLYGSVDSAFVREHIRDLVTLVPGVVEVKNYIDTSIPLASKSDWELAFDVRDRLRWNPLVDSRGIRVTASDGAVTLTGNVQTWFEWQQAEAAARHAGAARVINRLTLDFGPDDARPGEREEPRDVPEAEGADDPDNPRGDGSRE